MATVYEVEMKFSVADPAVLRARLGGVGGVFSAPRTQIDRYYAHPSRDFAVTDEALRLRRDTDRVAITWKGPRIDAATKTRREIELPLVPAEGGPAATLAAWDGLLFALGFRPVREVRKRRTTVHLDWQSAAVEVAIDEVEGLGTFVELEQQVAAAGVEAARGRLLALAESLACGPSERRSYLELLLATAREG
jgi:adenylate cyclase class 2